MDNKLKKVQIANNQESSDNSAGRHTEIELHEH